MQGPEPAVAKPRGRGPRGFLGMIALILAVEAAIAGHRLEFLDPVSVTWALSDRAAGREALESPVLCFGDSLLKFGFRPGVVEARAGRKAFNLAVVAGRAPSSFFLLRRALDAGARPSAVLIDFEPNILAQSPVLNHELWAELIGPRDIVELARDARDPVFLGRTLLVRSLPSVRYRLQLRGAVLAMLGGQSVARPDVAASLDRYDQQYRGAQVMPHADRALVPADARNLAFFPPWWGCDPVNRRYVKKFFELASSRGIPVFWVIPPYAPPIQALREQLGQDAKITHFAESIRSRYPGVTVLDGRRSGFDHSEFWDGTVHLDDQGALALTAGVADVLVRSFSGEKLPAWVALPAWRARALGDPTPAGVAARGSGAQTR